MQKRRNSIANALELRLFCIKPPICQYVFAGEIWSWSCPVCEAKLQRVQGSASMESRWHISAGARNIPQLTPWGTAV